MSNQQKKTVEELEALYQQAAGTLSRNADAPGGVRGSIYKGKEYEMNLLRELWLTAKREQGKQN